MNLSNLQQLLPGAACVQTYYRIVHAKYAPEIDETAHTVLHSWRFSPKGEFGVLYLSSTSECAYRENLKKVQGRKGDLPPLVTGPFEVHLSRCLDLTNPSCQQTLGVSPEQLLDPTDFTLTQSIARQARKLGFEAILAPSAVGADCRSLVVFKDKLNPPSYCICDRTKIKPYP